MKDLNEIFKSVRRLTQLAVLLSVLMTAILLLHFNIIHFPGSSNKEVTTMIPSVVEEILPGKIGSIDQESGLVIDHGFTVVIAQCGSCHSPKLVAQNRFNREGWIEVIRWMQDKQNLWDLGELEVVVLDYLEKNCAPNKVGRRKKLENVDWYVLN